MAFTKWKVSFTAVCLVLSCLAFSSVEAQCGPRVRRNWNRLSATQKDVYRRAVERAMDEGLYIKFVEMHHERMSEAEAHNTCVFLYWHRMFLIGFENMLRGFGGEFSCITIPYWDYVSESTAQTSGGCNSFESCSLILRELGGSQGAPRSMNIGGLDHSTNRCVAESPLDHFCEREGITGNQCARCVPRGNWQQRRIPSEANFISVYNQVFRSGQFGTFTTAVETGVHNNIHARLSGVMGTLQSPADPIFYSHHATIDALQSIRYKCTHGENRISALQKQENMQTIAQSCERQRNGGTIRPNSRVTMRNSNNGNLFQVNQQGHNLSPFFANVPDQYYELVDTRDMGENSYSYELGGDLGNMYQNCQNSNQQTTPQPSVTSTPSPSPSSTPSPSDTTTPSPSDTTTPSPSATTSTQQPTTVPSIQPSIQPTTRPTRRPTRRPTPPTGGGSIIPPDFNRNQRILFIRVFRRFLRMGFSPNQIIGPLARIIRRQSFRRRFRRRSPRRFGRRQRRSQFRGLLEFSEVRLLEEQLQTDLGVDFGKKLKLKPAMKSTVAPTSAPKVAKTETPKTITTQTSIPSERPVPLSTADQKTSLQKVEPVVTDAPVPLHTYSPTKNSTKKKPCPDTVETVILPIDESTRKFNTFYAEVYSATSSVSKNDIPEQIEYMHCMYQNSIAKEQDYTEKFKRIWGITRKPRCKQIVDDINSKKLQIKLTNWENIFAKHIPFKKTGGYDSSDTDEDQGYKSKSSYSRNYRSESYRYRYQNTWRSNQRETWQGY